MSARASFTASAFLAALPLAAAVFGLYRLLSSWPRSTTITPVAGICQLAYEQTLDRTGHLGVALLLAIVFLFTCRAILALWHGWRRTAGIGCRLMALPNDATRLIDRLQRESPRAARIEVVYGDAPFAITLGYFRPRIALSCRLVEMLDEQELEAVIRHEFVHADRRDPLRVLCAEFFRAGLPFVPALLYLLEQFRLRKEIEADAAVVQCMGSPAPLASALGKVIAGMRGPPTYEGAGLNPTEARIDALLGAAPERSSSLRIVALTVVSWLTISMMSGALFVLFSSPSVITKHICLPGNL